MQNIIDQIKAEAIAKAGAAKMEGYTYEKDSINPTMFLVTKPGAEQPYVVCPEEGVLAYCDCPFAKENGICKHQIWLRDELAYEAAKEAEAEEIAAWEGFGKYLQASYH